MERVKLIECSLALLAPTHKGKGKDWKKIDIDISTLYRLARMGTTQAEAASFFCMGETTFEQRLQRDDEMRAIWDRGISESKLSLRRLQLKHAERPGMAGVTMTIHLSKHWLGEHDMPTSLTQIKNEGPAVMSFCFDSPAEKLHNAGMD